MGSILNCSAAASEKQILPFARFLVFTQPGSFASQPSPAKTQQWSLFPESGHDFKAFLHPRQGRPPLQPKEHDYARQCQFLAARPQADTRTRLRAPSDISALRWMTLFPSPNRLTSEIGPGEADTFRPSVSPAPLQAVIATRRSVTPAHPPKSAEQLALERGTWFDMYSGRAARLGNPTDRVIRTGFSPQTTDREVDLGSHSWTKRHSGRRRSAVKDGSAIGTVADTSLSGARIVRELTDCWAFPGTLVS